MSHHLQKMKNLFNELQQRNMDFTETHKVYIILSSLPESYDNLVTSLETMSERELNLQYITARLLEEARKRDERLEDKVRRSSPQRKGDDSPERRRQASPQRSKADFRREEKANKAFAVKRCFICNSERHLQRDCFQASSRRNKTDRKGSTFLVQAEEDKTKVTASWILDSGAVNHITIEDCFLS